MRELQECEECLYVFQQIFFDISDFSIMDFNNLSGILVARAIIVYMTTFTTVAFYMENDTIPERRLFWSMIALLFLGLIYIVIDLRSAHCLSEIISTNLENQ